jgi:hypothetical protein
MDLSTNEDYHQYMNRRAVGEHVGAEILLRACIAAAEQDGDQDTTIFLLQEDAALTFMRGEYDAAAAKLEEISQRYGQDPNALFAVAKLTYTLFKDPLLAIRRCNAALTRLADFTPNERRGDFSTSYYVARIMSLRARCALETAGRETAAADLMAAFALCSTDHFDDAIEVCKNLVGDRNYQTVAVRYLSSVLTKLPMDVQYSPFRASIEAVLHSAALNLER